MYQLVITLLLAGSFILVGVAFYYMRQSQKTLLEHSLESGRRERELKRKLLELQVLRSLGERVGYSLNLQQILDVITGSLVGLVDYSTVSYMMKEGEHKVLFKLHTTESISKIYIEQIKNQLLTAFTTMTGHSLQNMILDEVISGSALDNANQSNVGSFFNLPIIVGKNVVAVINISSIKPGLYGDEETAVLYSIMDQVSTHATKLVAVVENEKKKLSAMIASLDDGVLMVDQKLEPLVINPALSRLLGLKDGVNLYDVVASVGTQADLDGAIRQSLIKEIQVQLPEMELNSYALRVDIEPVKDKSGQLLGAAVIFHNVTEEKRLEQMREEFTAMMVHELRTPLTTISYSLDALGEDPTKSPPAALEKVTSLIKNTTGEMLSLVTELLDVARIEAGKFEVVKSEDDLKSLIEEKISGFKPQADQKQVKLVSAIDSDLNTVSFDRTRLGQSLSNLISNALKYTDSGQIIIEARKQDHQVVVSVRDSGDGIKPEDLPRLFSKFTQLGKGKTGQRKGTGLGLVVTKGIIEAHGGKIWATSPGPGHGSTFSFSLPL